MTLDAPLAAPLVDAHAHTWSREFEGDYEQTIARAWESGLSAIVEVGTDSETSLRALALAQADPRVYAVGGLHPHEAKRLPEEQAALRALLEGGDFVAVGEIGLDFYRNLSPADAQYEALRWQLDLAREFELPVVIHSRSADEECYGVIEQWAKRTGPYLGAGREVGMMHCYAGDTELAERYRALGFLISVPGTVTYANNSRGREVARSIPLEAMLVETDCPYLTPVPHRGTRNEPAFVVHTAQTLADLWGMSLEDVKQRTGENTARLFSLTA